jgi:hypothetical protein
MDNAAIKERAIEAYLLLNTLVSDFITGVRSIELIDAALSYYSDKSGRVVSAEVERGIARMCFTHIVICLARWSEVYEHYSSVRDATLPECKALDLDLKRRKVHEFRNKYAAHIRDKKTSRPLTPEKIQEYIETITQGDPEAFLKWVRGTVVVATETWREQIMTRYGLTEADLFAASADEAEED